MPAGRRAAVFGWGICYRCRPDVAEQTIPAPRLGERIRVPGGDAGQRIADHVWIVVAAGVLLAGVLFVVITHMLPAYDAHGWLVWGRQAWHWNLNLNAAPSWKPLPFLFTFFYTLAGPSAARWLWMVTAAAGAFAGPVFAARIAYRLAGPAPGRRYAPFVGALFAGAAILGIHAFFNEVLSSTSDPSAVALLLAAIDCHLRGRRRWAWLLLVALSLDRPEAWVPTGLYALWTWRTVPSMRVLLLAGAAAIPLLWFGIAALASRSWAIASDVALTSTANYAGTPISRLWPRLNRLYELPMQLTALYAAVLTLVRRDRSWLLLLGVAALWLATETGLALHGWNPAPRYLWEPVAVLIVLAGGAIGWTLANMPRRLLLRLAAIAAFVAVIATMIPHARIRVRMLHTSIILTRNWAGQINRLPRLIAHQGGRTHILFCGHAVTDVPFQSILAWELNQNVSSTGWNPPAEIKAGQPIVLYTPIRKGWKLVGWNVKTIHTRPAKQAECSRLQTELFT